MGDLLPTLTAADCSDVEPRAGLDSSVVVALDVTCLLFGPLALNPRGIDRVEMAYASHFLESWAGACVVVMPTPWGMRYFDRSWALRGLRALEDIWRERIRPDDDTAYQRTKAFIRGLGASQTGNPAPAVKTIRAQAHDFIRLLLAAGFSWGKPVRSLPDKAIYLNVGQLLFFRPWLSWLAARRDIVRVVMLHDLIPLEYPDHHVRLGVRLHEKIVENTARFADALILPSEFARRGLTQPFVPQRLAMLPAHVELLPVAPAFLQAATPDFDLDGTSYFLACGAIDAHKNHILLLRVWERLLGRHGANAPKLVIAGFRSVTSEPVFQFLAERPALQSHVCIASGVSTPALRLLMMSAKALLMPSLVEGFGLPIVEALAQGTAVIASDIPAFREAGARGRTTFLPATDPDAWLAVIDGFSHVAMNANAPYRPKRWPDYFAGIEAFLADTRRLKNQ